MSQENVDIVRWFFQVLERAFDAYWRSPRSIAAAVEAQDLWPEWREAFECVHPDYRPSLEEVADLGGDQVFAVVGLVGKGKNSRLRMDARFFDVFTVREGLIVRIEEYTGRNQALEAVGLSEQDAHG